MIKVKDFKMLEALPNHSPDELALVEDENKVYIYRDGWIEYNPEDGGLTLSIYELNKMVVPKLPDLTEEDIKIEKEEIKKYVSKPGYWMLLSNEKKYYTLFHVLNKTSLNKVEDEVIECLKDLGAIKSIAENDDDVIEIWIADNEDAFVCYLFNYDKGVIECR